MPRFTTRPKALIVEACVPAADATVHTEEGVLFGVELGSWYVVFPDGTKKIMAHAKFIKMFEPADAEAAAYLASTMEVPNERHGKDE